MVEEILLAQHWHDASVHCGDKQSYYCYGSVGNVLLKVHFSG